MICNLFLISAWGEEIRGLTAAGRTLQAFSLQFNSLTKKARNAGPPLIALHQGSVEDDFVAFHLGRDAARQELPDRISCASGFSIQRWIARFSGRAPYTGS
jgi:hypothetical protein